jgi:hypothetical protein
LEIQQGDEQGAGEKQPEEAEEGPAEEEVPAGELVLVHVTKGSMAAAAKRRAR